MRTRHTELDVDFIGGMRPLTKEDEKTISEFIKANKLKRVMANKAKSTRLKRTHSATGIK